MATPVLKIAVLFCSFAFLTATTAVGLAFLHIPSSQAEQNPWVRVSSLAAISDDGIPHEVPLFAKQSDGWTKLPDRVVGRVFVRRVPGADRVLAIHPVTPFGSVVSFDENAKAFAEPCWGMIYDINGTCLNEKPNPGDLKLLRTKTEGGTVFVALNSPLIRGNP